MNHIHKRDIHVADTPSGHRSHSSLASWWTTLGPGTKRVSVQFVLGPRAAGQCGLVHVEEGFGEKE